jgi:hypothetical protein
VVVDAGGIDADIRVALLAQRNGVRAIQQVAAGWVRSGGAGDLALVTGQRAGAGGDAILGLWLGIVDQAGAEEARAGSERLDRLEEVTVALYVKGCV